MTLNHNRWSRRHLGDVADVISGYAFKSADFGDEGIPVIKIKNIRIGSVDLSDVAKVAEKHLSIPDRFHVRGGDILISLTGSHISQPNSVVGRVARHSSSYPRCLLNQRAGKVIVRDETKYDQNFIFYALSEPETMRAIAMLAHGAASQANVSPTQVKSIEISIPPVGEQRRIAGILSAYDELIENSQRRIQILETMARNLYREWFIHFRFPGSGRENGNEPSSGSASHPLPEGEGEGAQQSPSTTGRGVGGEGAAHAQPEKVEIIDGIPEGWEKVAFGEIYNTGSGGTPSRKRPEYFEGGSIDWIKSKELKDGFIFSTEEYITEQAVKKSSAKIFPANTVLIALYGATIGRLGILANEAATNQACCAVLQKHPAFGREFAFLTLFTNRDRIIGLRLGAAQQNISQVILRSMECVKPTNKLAREFSKRTAPIFDGILTLQRQIINLRQTRDLLLPRLLSEKINLRED